MSKLFINALPELTDAGIISVDTAEQIKAYYQQKSHRRPDRLNLIFGVIGSILVGLGIILIAAHNWDQLTRPLKALFSFAPLVAGQGLCGYCLLKKKDNVTWRECSASFLFFAVGASVALVAQVYNIPGNTARFLFTWMLLSFPLVYIMPSSITALLYLAGITAYGVADGYGYRAAGTYNYWWLLLLILPHYILLIVKKSGSNITFFHHWIVPLSLTIGLGTLLDAAGQYAALAYMSLFAVYYFIGFSWSFYSQERVGANAYVVLGSLGSMILLLVTSFRDFWDGILGRHDELSRAALLGIFVPALMAAGLLLRALRQKKGQAVNPLVFAFPAFFVIFFIGRQEPFVGALLMNAIILAIGVWIVLRGLQLNHLGLLNYGLMVIAVLVICRFFDTNISFVIRGLLFVAVGAGFFFANSLLMKKRRAL